MCHAFEHSNKSHFVYQYIALTAAHLDVLLHGTTCQYAARPRPFITNISPCIAISECSQSIMNWTSGKLERLKKANKDSVRKRQRNYTARKRLDQGTHPHSPIALAHFQTEVPQQDPPRPTTSHYFAAGSSDQQEQPNSAHQKYQNDSLDPLEHVRRQLLKRRDWSGLSLARPNPVIFKPSTDMDQVGRRRKRARKTTEQSHKHYEGRQKRPDLKRLVAMKHGKNIAPTPDLDQQDYSIRLGSNIHQTQTTYSGMREQETVTILTAVPDNIEPQKHDPDQSYAEPNSEQRQQGAAEDRHLIPLNEARQLKSFDEVQRRSSSIVRQAFSSSNPFLSKPTRLKPFGVKSFGDKRELPVGQPLAPMAVQHESRNERQTYLIPAESVSIACRSANTSVQVHPSQHTERLSHGLNSIPNLSSPRFTIDHQVLLERQMQNAESEQARRTSNSFLLPSLSQQQAGLIPSNNSVAPIVSPVKRYTDLEGLQHTSISNAGTDEPPRKRRRVEDASESSSEIASIYGFSKQSNAGMNDSLRGEDSEINLRERFLRAKRRHEEQMLARIESADTRSLQSGTSDNEYEAWMQDVFPKAMGDLQQNFSFSPSGPQHRQQSPSIRKTQQPLFNRSSSDFLNHDVGLQPTSTSPIRTDVNAPMYPVQLAQSQPFLHRLLQSETDFISRLSPMEGVIDEGLGPVSLYGNAPRSDRSHLPVQNRGGPRFEKSQYFDNDDTVSQPPVTPMNREPLKLLAQPRLWSTSEGRHGHKPVTVSQHASMPRQPATPLWDNAMIEDGRTRLNLESQYVASAQHLEGSQHLGPEATPLPRHNSISRATNYQRPSISKYRTPSVPHWQPQPKFWYT